MKGFANLFELQALCLASTSLGPYLNAVNGNNLTSDVTQATATMKTSVAASAIALASSAAAHWGSQEHDIKYVTETGYFLQDDPSTNATGFDYTYANFGLLNRTYPTDTTFDPFHYKKQWERFAHWVDFLNLESELEHKGTRYKLLVLGRHGEGYHNVAESFYGTPAWNCYWAELNGNGTIVWEDALLTSAGAAQAEKANAYFKSRFEHQGMPYFESYYVSPLARCLYTANITFGTLDLSHRHGFIPTVKEKFREGISIHTCDHRSSKTWIHKTFPSFRIEHGFAENDPLWEGAQGKGETVPHQAARSKQVLDDVFKHDSSTWVSVTSHSGEIAALLSVLGHRAFSLGTGQIIPVLVKAELVKPTPTTAYVGFTAEATCTSPPVTSISGQGCVCSTDSKTLAKPTVTN